MLTKYINEVSKNIIIKMLRNRKFASWVGRQLTHVLTPDFESGRSEHCNIITEITL